MKSSYEVEESNVFSTMIDIRALSTLSAAYCGDPSDPKVDDVLITV